MAEANVSTPSVAYKAMSERWELIDALDGGTRTMRAGDTRWLPIEDAENRVHYQARLDRSVLYNAFSDTVGKLVSRPFSRAVQVQGVAPDKLSLIEEDADWNGTSLTDFTRAAFEDLVKYGLTHILIDYPVGTETFQLGQELEAGVHPYFRHVKARDLIGWRTTKALAGRDDLGQVRYCEERIEEDGPWADKLTKFVRLWEPDKWEEWKELENNKWMKVQEGPNPLGRIPLVTVYANRVGPLLAMPPLEDLAWLNLAHWQSMSDQRNILHVARVPFLFRAGFTEDELKQPMVLSAGRSVGSTRPDAKIGWVEPGGAAIQLGDQDLKSLEARMEVLGLSPLMTRSGDVTATAAAMDEARSESDMQSWTRALEIGMRRAYDVAALWANVTLADDFSVDINQDFGLSLRATQDVQALISMRATGQISHELFLREVRRRGVISESVDVEEEIERVEANRPVNPFSFPPGKDDDEEEEDEEETEEDGPPSFG